MYHTSLLPFSSCPVPFGRSTHVLVALQSKLFSPKIQVNYGSGCVGPGLTWKTNYWKIVPK